MGTDETDVGTQERGDRPRWLLVGAGLVALLVITGALVVHRRVERIESRVCADIGADGPAAESPQEALDAYFDDVDATLGISIDRSTWAEDDGAPVASSDIVAFTSPISAPDKYFRHLSEIFTDRRADGRWAVSGGCVG